MRIPIKLNDLKESNERFPPQLVKLASNELVLIELQGALEVEGNKKGQLIGTLNLDNPFSFKRIVQRSRSGIVSSREKLFLSPSHWPCSASCNKQETNPVQCQSTMRKYVLRMINLSRLYLSSGRRSPFQSDLGLWYIMQAHLEKSVMQDLKFWKEEIYPCELYCTFM